VKRSGGEAVMGMPHGLTCALVFRFDGPVAVVSETQNQPLQACVELDETQDAVYAERMFDRFESHGWGTDPALMV